MTIQTKGRKDYKKVEVSIADGGTSIYYEFWGEKEIEQFKEELKSALEDCEFVLEHIKTLKP